MAGVTNEPPAATVAPDTASELTVLPMPGPSADQVVPSHLAMRVAGLPPAVVKAPPTYRSLPETASALAAPPSPVPKGDQLLPFHLEILFAGETEPAMVKV